MKCQCNGTYTDFIAGTPEEIEVNVILEPDADYVWELEDGFGNLYYQSFHTNMNGAGKIDMSLLPAGFINPAQATLKVRIKANESDCDYVPMPFLVHYDQAEVSFQQGSFDKASVGCEIDLAPEGAQLNMPQNLMATKESERTVLTWEPPLDAPAGTEYIVKKNGITIGTTTALTFAAEGLTNGVEYVFSVTASYTGYSDSVPATIFVTPSDVVTGYWLAEDNNSVPVDEAYILANGVPFEIITGEDYAIQFTNTTNKFWKVFEPVDEPLKTKNSVPGMAADEFGPGGLFAAGGVVVGTLRGYMANYKSKNTVTPINFNQ